MTSFRAGSRPRLMCLLGVATLGVAASAPGGALADALSANTFSLSLQLSAPQDNLFGYAYKSAGAKSVTSNPAAQGGPTLDIVVPQDVVFVSPTDSKSKTTSTTFQINLANLSGSGGGAKPAQTFNPTLSGAFTYHLDDSAVDNPLYDSASSAYFITVTLNGAVIYTDTLSAADPQDRAGTIGLPLGGIVLPANSLSKLVFQMALSAEAASVLPPAPPPILPPPPPPPTYPAVPEPATWALMLVGFGLVGGVVRRRGRRTAGAAI